MNEEISRVVARLEDAALSLRALCESGAEHVFEGADFEPDKGSVRPCGPWPEKNNGILRSRSPVLSMEGAVAPELEIVETMISVRFLRDRFFDNDLFFDPSWSMLIDMYRAELKEQQLSVTSVCIGSGVAGTTALRYIKLLEERGYIRRVADPHDKRRAFLRLTERALDRLQRYFDTVGTKCRAE
jgi:predicted transcriptional regulator